MSTGTSSLVYNKKKSLKSSLWSILFIKGRSKPYNLENPNILGKTASSIGFGFSVSLFLSKNLISSCVDMWSIATERIIRSFVNYMKVRPTFFFIIGQTTTTFALNKLLIMHEKVISISLLRSCDKKIDNRTIEGTKIVKIVYSLRRLK